MTIKIILVVIGILALFAGAFWVAILIDDGKKAGIVDTDYVGLNEKKEGK